MLCLALYCAALNAQESESDSLRSLLGDFSIEEHGFAPVSASLNESYFLPRTVVREASVVGNYNMPRSALVAYYYHGGQPSVWRSRLAERVFTEQLNQPLIVQPYDFKVRSPERTSIGFRRKETNSLSLVIPEAVAYMRTKSILEGLQISHPDILTYASQDLKPYLPNRIISADVKSVSQTDSIPVPPKDVERWMKMQLPKRKNWFPSLESTLQISQNYVSDNWHKGGASNLNLYSREYLKIDYIKDKVRWTNEVESKFNIYNISGDSLRNYRIADDVLRIHSNLGYKAFKHWFYTLDGEVRTQLFNAYKENSHDLQAAILAPVHIDFGLGMKYELERKSSKVYARKIKLSLNIAPLSYNFHASLRKDVDLARHGFPAGKLIYHTLGSSVKADLMWNFNMNISWQSRLNFMTTYKKIEAEWENSLNIAFSRFFSTRININLRYDNTVPPSETALGRLQLYELISIGFNYRW